MGINSSCLYSIQGGEAGIDDLNGSHTSKRVKRSHSGHSLDKYPTAVLAAQSQNAGLAGVVKGTLKRRVSTCVLKHKLRKFQV